ncbi:hypothetical protein [Orenia marismortui]|uniref:hypothetical protein n=1 Tax=Orenia marismortui TaxID=46469 RepID=UPI0012FCE5A4|nr:hypothetical protein [Orenia marismortui]
MFEIINNNHNQFQVSPYEADKLYIGTLNSKREGRKEKNQSPEAVGEWEKLTPIRVIVAIKQAKYEHQFEEQISIYPFPYDLTQDL